MTISTPNAYETSKTKISGDLLARNTFWNLVGRGAPLLLAFLAIPILIRSIGTDCFGVLTLAWMVIGYFSLFDFGIGRALTMLIARSIGAGDEDDVHSLIWTGLVLMAIMGILGGLFGFAITPWLARNVLKIPTELLSDTVSSFYLLSATIPCVVVTAGLIGILEAYQHFKAVNSVRLFMGVFNYLGPLLILPFSKHLPAIIALMALGRFLAFFIYLSLCLKTVPKLRTSFEFRQSHIKPIISFGGWLTVSNIVSPIMVFMDRFFIGAILSVTAVAYYTTPYEVITKISILPEAIVATMFSALTISLVNDRNLACRHFRQVVKLLIAVVFPIIFLTVMFAPETLTLWLNAKFAQNSSLVLQILAIGVFINCIARLPFTLIQSAGKPGITAKLHLFELLIYLPALWYCTGRYGIVGAAFAWSGRIAIDMVLLFLVTIRLIPELTSFIKKVHFLVLLLSLILAGGTTNTSSINKGILVVTILTFTILISWVYLPEQRKFIAEKISLLRS
jgi:O-antigen/teichoic acid export membrane protein